MKKPAGWKTRGRADAPAAQGAPAQELGHADAPAAQTQAAIETADVHAQTQSETAEAAPAADHGPVPTEIMTVGTRVYTASADCIPSGYVLASKTGVAVASGPMKGWFLLKRAAR